MWSQTSTALTSNTLPRITKGSCNIFSCDREILHLVSMAWISDNTWPLFCKVRQIGNRLVELRSHKQFLRSCKDENLIANRFIIKNRITLGNFRRRRNIQNKFMETSRYAQGEVLDWTKEEVCLRE